MSRFWSNNISELTPYTPGEQPQIDGLIKLNTNENPYGPSPQVIDAIAAANGGALRKYPDPNSRKLKSQIADYYQLQADQVFVGNSSDEVLGHVFRALLKHADPLLSPDISYSFYPVYCQLFDIQLKQIPLRADFSLNVTDYAQRNGGIIFANPNAPTGLALSNADLEQLLLSNTDSVAVVDEAYVDFAEQSAVALVNRFENLLVTQTLSKSRSLAGLRVGLALGHANLIEALERVKNSFHPYALDSLAQAGASAAFADEAYFKECVAKVVGSRQMLTQELQKLGFEVLPSQANFVFAKHVTYQAEKLFEALRARNILVRYFNAPRVNNHLRISIGTEQEMLTLVSTLAEIIAR